MNLEDFTVSGSSERREIEEDYTDYLPQILKNMILKSGRRHSNE